MTCPPLVLRPSSPWLVSGVEPTAYSFASVPCLNPPHQVEAASRELAPADDFDALHDTVIIIKGLKSRWSKLPQNVQEDYIEILHQINSHLQDIIGDGNNEKNPDWGDFTML